MKISYTEKNTEKLYDEVDSLCRQFWDKDGSLHWGYFNDFTAEDFLEASRRWTKIMLERSGITSSSKILDIGCGNGNSAIFIAKQTGCQVVGIDLSNIRIQNALELATKHPDLDVMFHKASITSLPFDDAAFTHVWSQATIYHVHERKKGLLEIYRVLQDRGILIFDDLVQPKSVVSNDAKTHVFERMLFEQTWSYQEYLHMLSSLGFIIHMSEDLTKHLRRSYELLANMVKPISSERSFSYHKMCEAIDSKELGWAFYKCEKIQDRLSWIYDIKGKEELENKYDLWATLYDTDLENSYRKCPDTIVKLLKQVVSKSSVSILDAGCGTGLVGESLYKEGFTNITGVDFSQKSIDIAQKKHVYSELFKGDLEKPGKLFENCVFDAILSVGVFTYGHVEPGALRYLCAWLKEDGYLGLVVRKDYLETYQPFQKQLTLLGLKEIKSETFKILDERPIWALLYRKSSNNMSNEV